jgi:hypothetical protein
MRLMTALTATALMLAVTACSDDGDTADDPAGDPSDQGGAHGPMPTEPVAADGEVVTRYAATVMDTGSPELCLGPVAESYPPQCGGPPLEGWDWAAYEGAYDQQGDVRWGVFFVTGTWDGTTFVVASAEPGDGSIPTEPELPPPPDDPPSTDELGRIADEVRDLGRATGAYANEAQVLVDVPYDDGSLQAWVDEEYGDGVVAVTASLIDA